MSRVMRERARAVIISAWVTIALSPMVRGTMKTRSRTAVIVSTASQRRFQSFVCTRSITGQVATTIVVAHSRANRKGLRIQIESAMRPPMNSTAKTMRAMSDAGAEGAAAGGTAAEIAGSAIRDQA
jgi:hypothetical protein